MRGYGENGLARGEAGDARTEPWVAEGEGKGSMSEESDLRQEPRWFTLFVTGVKAASVGTEAGRGVELVMRGGESSTLMTESKVI